jgi:hypothetical protein
VEPVVVAGGATAAGDVSGSSAGSSKRGGTGSAARGVSVSSAMTIGRAAASVAGAAGSWAPTGARGIRTGSASGSSGSRSVLAVNRGLLASSDAVDAAGSSGAADFASGRSVSGISASGAAASSDSVNGAVLSSTAVPWSSSAGSKAVVADSGRGSRSVGAENRDRPRWVPPVGAIAWGASKETRRLGRRSVSGCSSGSVAGGCQPSSAVGSAESAGAATISAGREGGDERPMPSAQTSPKPAQPQTQAPRMTGRFDCLGGTTNSCRDARSVSDMTWSSRGFQTAHEKRAGSTTTGYRSGRSLTAPRRQPTQLVTRQ